MSRDRASPLLFQTFQSPRAPGLELFTDVLRVPIGGDDDMDVIRATVDGVESPAPDPAMVRDGRFDELALFVIEATGVVGHAGGGLPLRDGIR
jgi:hypothetical protein